MLLFIPLIIYQNVVLPVYILPSAQALGIWGRVTQFFSLAWTFFDLGTSIAFIKYLSEYRVHDPKTRHPVRTVVRLVAGAFGGGPGHAGDRPGQHAGAAFGLRPVCLERHHPCPDPGPGLLARCSATP